MWFIFFFLQKADFSRLASHNRAYINIHYCSNSLAMGMATRSRNSPSSDRYCTVSAASDLALPTSLWPWSIQNPNIALFQSFVFFLGPRKAILTRREINGVGILSKPDFLQFFRQNRACRYLLSPSLPPIKGEYTQQLMADFLPRCSPDTCSAKHPMLAKCPSHSTCLLPPMLIGRAEALAAPAHRLTDKQMWSFFGANSIPNCNIWEKYYSHFPSKSKSIFANHFTAPFT